ncbi:DUF4240 domain-containing protein [Streptomyces sp. RB6PN25]|uniref:DUF4240 domain-containing protein n=1 Tax=Streptomyces humicola TaxID=2953240 RepID=A0ABT1PVD1_9ACTN|nr:DUF4240 domain-containing protein [Streptomyces humicola]MCQ4081615.1 DUF4240 domain-containing protein [Streptomyces humicola]
MDETEFWEIIDTARETADGDPYEQADLVVEKLAQLDPDAVLDFARHFETRMNRAYRWDLWGAADILLGGVDEDAFDSFRCWLISRGRHAYEGALHQPDDLASLVKGFDEDVDGDAEDLGYAADEAYEQLTGVRLPDLGLRRPAEPAGARLDLDNDAAMADRLPTLWQRYGR